MPVEQTRSQSFEPCRYRDAQNEQWCLDAKSFTISGCSGTSDMICAPLKECHGTAADDGSPFAAKLARPVRMVAASASSLWFLSTGKLPFTACRIP
jgi:hypothetical protein